MKNKSTKKIWICAGTAGELIKIYPVIKEIESFLEQIEWRFLFTGQSPHNFIQQWIDFSLNDEFLVKLVNTKSDLKNISQAVIWFLSGILLNKKKFENKVKNKFGFHPSKNDYWVVHGDTLSTLMGSKWCSMFDGKLIHIEAGLRSTSILRPFPEEITRRIVSRLTNIHFPQDDFARSNLIKKSVEGEIISTDGNTLYDTLQLICSKDSVEYKPLNHYVLVNIHRNENLSNDKRWQIIIETICKAAVQNKIKMVLHPPTSEKLMQDKKSKIRLEEAGVELLPRIIYSKFLGLINQARFIITDGGSNQEECAYLGKPCLILKNRNRAPRGSYTKLPFK